MIELEKLHIMPELKRNEENKTFEYDSKYHNRLFEHKGNIVFIKKSAYDTFPLSLFNVLKVLTEETLQNKFKDIETSITKNVGDSLSKITSNISPNDIDGLKDFINSLLPSVPRFQDMPGFIEFEADTSQRNDRKIEETVQQRLLNPDSLYIQAKNIIGFNEFITKYIPSTPNVSEIIKSSEFESKISTVIDSKISQKNQGQNQPQNVQQIVDDTIANSFNNFNRVINNMQEQIAGSIDLKMFQQFRDEVQRLINSLFEEKQKESSPEGLIERFEELETKLESIAKSNISLNETYQKTRENIAFDSDKVREIVHEELKVVHDNMGNMIREAVSNSGFVNGSIESMSTALVPINPEIPDKSVPIGKLMGLKEAGYSVEDIIKLKNEGLI